MTRKETIAVIELIRRAYPRFIEASPWEPDIEKAVIGTVDLWAEMFAHDDLSAVTAAVRHYIQTGRFPPTIADIRAILTDMRVPAVTAGEIWDEVQRLLGWNISPHDSERAYAHMTEVCKEAVLAVGGWYALSMSPENDPYTRRVFLQAAQKRIDQDRQQGIPFDRSKQNQLVRREALRLHSVSGGGCG